MSCETSYVQMSVWHCLISCNSRYTSDQQGVIKTYQFIREECGGYLPSHRPNGGTQPTKHAPHAWIPEPRRSQVCNCPPHSAVLCTALSVSCSLFTILDNKKENRTVSRETMMAWRGEHTMNGGRYPRCLGVTMIQFAHYQRESEK